MIKSQMPGWRNGSGVKSTDNYFKGPVFNSQNPTDNSQQSITSGSNTLIQTQTQGKHQYTYI